jgi:LysR family transcriptional activator of glutamate synthase operon
MDFHQLKVFYSAVSTGSFTRASQTLNLSQSTISQHIKQLESELGCHLFRRVGRGVHLTEAGQLLRDHCEKIFQDVKNAEMAIKELNGQQRGRIRFGSGATTLIYQLPAVIEAFNAQFPNIELVIFSDKTEAIIHEIKAQRLDLGLVMKPPAEHDLQFTPLCNEELLIAVSNKHPLASKRALTIQDLQDLRFILYEKKTVMRKLIDDFFHQLGIAPQIAMVMENIEAIKSLVGTGLGASVLPAHAVGEDALDKKVRMLRVQNCTLRRQLGLIQLKSNLLPNVVHQFSQLIINQLGAKARNKPTS